MSVAATNAIKSEPPSMPRALPAWLCTDAPGDRLRPVVRRGWRRECPLRLLDEIGRRRRHPPAVPAAVDENCDDRPRDENREEEGPDDPGAGKAVPERRRDREVRGYHRLLVPGTVDAVGLDPMGPVSADRERLVVFEPDAAIDAEPDRRDPAARVCGGERARHFRGKRPAPCAVAEEVRGGDRRGCVEPDRRGR